MEGNSEQLPEVELARRQTTVHYEQVRFSPSDRTIMS